MQIGSTARRIAFLLCLLIPAFDIAAAPIDDLKAWLTQPRDQRPPIADQPFAKTAVTKTDAEKAIKLLWEDHVTDIKQSRKAEWDAKAITIGQHTLKLKTKTIGAKPDGGWNLFISLHGGGGAPTSRRFGSRTPDLEVDLATARQRAAARRNLRRARGARRRRRR